MHGILSALPAAGVIFSFIGYSPAIQLAGEAKNPQRAIPLAIIGSISICIVLYVVLQAAFIGAVQTSSLAHGWAKMHFIGDAGPVAGIIASLGLVWFLKILYIDAVIKACADLVKPGGYVFFSTLNRNPKAYLFAVIGAEYVMKMLPKGTHDYQKFIKPAELDHWARQENLKMLELKGLHYNPLSKQYKLNNDVSVNYLAVSRRTS